MKEYRLSAWPDLGPQHQRTAYRRMLSDMSQRHMSVAELCARSGLSRSAVVGFIDQLAARGLLLSRDAARLHWPISLRPLRDWMRRARVLSPRSAPRA
jgi:DNA-binding IclR family transcriptional regulator